MITQTGQAYIGLFGVATVLALTFIFSKDKSKEESTYENRSHQFGGTIGAMYRREILLQLLDLKTIHVSNPKFYQKSSQFFDLVVDQLRATFKNEATLNKVVKIEKTINFLYSEKEISSELHEFCLEVLKLVQIMILLEFMYKSHHDSVSASKKQKSNQIVRKTAAQKYKSSKSRAVHIYMQLKDNFPRLRTLAKLIETHVQSFDPQQPSYYQGPYNINSFLSTATYVQSLILTKDTR